MYSSSSSSSHLYIPIRDSRDYVSVNLSSLPTDPHDLIDLLKLELAHPELWLIAAKEYLKRGLTNEFLSILNVITGPEAAEAYRNDSFRPSRISILNTLAAYESERGRDVRADSSQRASAWAAAISHLNAATELDLQASQTWCGKGFLLFFQGDFSSAENNFNTAISSERDRSSGGGSLSILPLLGKAICCAARNNYQEALNCYRKALTLFPKCPAEVRLGFGFCYLKLNQVDKARAAFNRVKQMDPENVQAALGLAVLDLNDLLSRSDGDPASVVSSVFSVLSSAFDRDPTNPGLLITLANHYFYSGEMGKVRLLAARVIELVQSQGSDANSTALRCEALFQLGRAYHAEGDLTAAAQYYQQASSYQGSDNPNWLLQLGLAQCLIASGRVSDSRPILTRLCSAHPGDYFVHRLLGSVCFQLRDFTEAAKQFSQALKLPAPVDLSLDPEVLLEFAQSQQLAASENSAGDLTQAARSALKLAHQNYEKAIKILQAASIAVPGPILNNYAVCSAQLGELALSESLYRQAIGRSDLLSYIDSGDESSPVPVDAELASSLYNFGLLLESQARFPSARRAFSALARSFPGYIDSTLRLGCIHSAAADRSGAEKLFLSALDRQPASIPVLTQIGVHYMAAGNLSEAAKNFIKIMRESTKGDQNGTGDSYAKLCLGNMQFQQGRSAARSAALMGQPNQSKAQSALAKAAEHFERAGKYYRSVLEKEPSNYAACNGLGMILASEGKYHEAREVFAAVREARPEFEDAQVNLAHIAVEQGQFSQAVKFYSAVLDRINTRLAVSGPDTSLAQRRASVLLFLARAHYAAGSMLDCQRVLHRALFHDPANLDVWYNLALAQEDFAIQILQRPKTTRTLSEVRDAVKQLSAASAIFQRVNSQAASSSALSQKAATHAQFCHLSFQSAQPHLASAEEREKQLKQLQEETARAREEHERRILEEEQLRKEREEKLIQEAQRVAKEKRDRLAAMMQSEDWKVEKDKDEEKQDNIDAEEDEKEEARKRAKKNKRKKKNENDQEEDDDEEEEQQETQEEQEENGKPEQDEVLQQLFGAEEDEAEAEAVIGQERRNQHEKKRRKIVDEDETENNQTIQENMEQ